MIIAAAACSLIVAGTATSRPEDPVAAITRWEQDAARADLAGNVSFYKDGLVDDWSDGMSVGRFQYKKELVSDLSDNANNKTFDEALSDMKVRVYGDTAIATYTETYDELTKGKRVLKTIITTDTFVKITGRWKQVAAHSSAVR